MGLPNDRFPDWSITDFDVWDCEPHDSLRTEEDQTFLDLKVGKFRGIIQDVLEIQILSVMSLETFGEPLVLALDSLE